MAQRSSLSREYSREQSALSVRVDTLDSDIREVKDSILGLDAKIENAVSGLAREVRSAVDSLRAQFSERQKTPWVAVTSVVTVLLLVLGAFGNQALTPIVSDIKQLKDQTFPKDEAIFRYSINDKRLTQLESDLKLIQSRRYDELTKRNEQLEMDLRTLRGISHN